MNRANCEGDTGNLPPTHAYELQGAHSIWGYDVEAEGDNLINAAACGDLEAAQRLLKNAPSRTEMCLLITCSEPGERWTPLHYAANNGHYEVAEELVRTSLINAGLKHEVALMPRTRHGDTPMHLCR